MVLWLVFIGMMIMLAIVGSGYVMIHFLNMNYTNLLEVVVVIMLIFIVYMLNRK